MKLAAAVHVQYKQGSDSACAIWRIFWQQICLRVLEFFFFYLDLSLIIFIYCRVGSLLRESGDVSFCRHFIFLRIVKNNRKN